MHSTESTTKSAPNLNKSKDAALPLDKKFDVSAVKPAISTPPVADKAKDFNAKDYGDKGQTAGIDKQAGSPAPTAIPQAVVSGNIAPKAALGGHTSAPAKAERPLVADKNIAHK
jgi:hypothetical protein